jgi:hypothetical protein
LELEIELAAFLALSLSVVAFLLEQAVRARAAKAIKRTFFFMTSSFFVLISSLLF